jgi:hypothetical protein
MPAQKVGFTDLQLGSSTRETPVPFFTREQAALIIEWAKEPFKTLFAIAWSTGMHAGEILALTLDDLHFTSKTQRANKSADANTRQIRQPKTKSFVAMLPMPSASEAMLRNYIRQWTPNKAGILFATRNGLRPRSRDNVAKCGLKPVLRKLGIPTANTGCMRFGMAYNAARRIQRTAAGLAKANAPLWHCDNAAHLHARDPAEPARRNGKRWNCSNRYVQRYVCSCIARLQFSYLSRLLLAD